LRFGFRTGFPRRLAAFRPKKQAGYVNEFTLAFTGSWFASIRETGGSRDMQCDYDGFKIESFEAGRGLWHARIRRADLKPVIIDGVSFSTLEVGFAWSDPDTAVADAKTQIDHLKLKRYATAEQMPQGQQSAA